MSAHANTALIKAVQDDEADVRWLSSQLQWKYGYVSSQGQFAAQIIGQLRERWHIDLIPAERSTQPESEKARCIIDCPGAKE